MTLEEYLEKIRFCNREEYFAIFGEIEQVLQSVEECLNGCDIEEKKAFLTNLGGAAMNFPIWMRIHMLSFCIKIGADAELAKTLIREVENADYEAVGEYNKLSHYWQISTALFHNQSMGSEELELGLTRLYKTLLDAFSGALGLRERAYLPAEQRDKSRVFVFISQVLGMEHAPTKTLLDRCYVLQKYLGKKVFIINTAMQLTKKGQAPFYKLVEGEYLPALSQWRELEFQGEKFEFFQCEDVMPDLSLIAEIARMVKEQKPYYILNIGGSDICADICGRIVPEITISTVFSKVAMSAGEYQIVDKQLTTQDERQLALLGVSAEKVKRALFTFSFKKQEHTLKRSEFGLTQDSFLLLLVGWRLDEEIDEAFLSCLAQVMESEERIEAVFMGKCEKLEAWMEKYPIFKQRCHNLGKQMDALAVTELCDLYVNPRRNGGGSSVSEALYKGIPAVTLPYGDVSVAAGESFWVADYEQMKEQMLRYARDNAFYQEMSQKAVERAALLTDSAKSFVPMMEEIEKELG